MISEFIYGSQYLLEILHTSLNVKNSENVIKSGCFKKPSGWKAPFFFKMKKDRKVSCIKCFMLC